MASVHLFQAPSTHLDSSERDWSILPWGPTGLIAERLREQDVADFLSLRAVCTSWRVCTSDPMAHGPLDERFHPRGWILLPSLPDDVPGRRHFLNLTSKRRIHLELPDLLGYTVASGASGSPNGVLVLVHERTLAVRVFNPLTLQITDLPSVRDVLSRRRRGSHDWQFRNLSTVTGAGFANGSTVVLHFGGDDRVVAAKPGDTTWEVICRGGRRCSLLHVAGRVYFANSEGVMEVDAAVSPQRLVRTAGRVGRHSVHLADNSGELILVSEELTMLDGRPQLVTRLFRLDRGAGQLVEVKSLGDRALIKCDMNGGALVVSAKDYPPLRTNAIYCGCLSGSFGVYMCSLPDVGVDTFVPERGSLVARVTSFITG